MTTFTRVPFLMPSCAGFLEPRKSRLRLSKFTFNAKNFMCSLSMSISIGFSAIPSLKVSRSPKLLKKIHKKPLFKRSRSSKVTEIGGTQEPVYDFLLVINSNLYRPYLAPLLRYSHLLAKNGKFCPLFFHLAPSFGVTPLEFMEKLYGS